MPLQTQFPFESLVTTPRVQAPLRWFTWAESTSAWLAGKPALHRLFRLEAHDKDDADEGDD